MTEKRAVSIDLDGFPFPRTPVQLDILKPWAYNAHLRLKHNPVTRHDRMPVTQVLSRKDHFILNMHNPRQVRMEIAEIIHKMQADIKIGNTGRPNNQPMVDLTMQRLEEGNLLPDFEYVLFAPAGVSSDESKYWGLVELQAMGFTDIVHYDDNARTQRRLAEALPGMRFIIVQDLTSGILFPRSEMEKFPNVARIAINRNGYINTVYTHPDFGRFPHSY